MQERALKILVTNDDGYSSKGINTLERLLVQYGDVLSVAPKDAQSAKSTALTMDVPLRLFKVESKTFKNGHTLDKYHLNGTPVDCVKAAIVKFFEDPNLLPDVVVSGINHGSNASAAALYSGTLGATKEGALYGIPSIGFSLDNIYPNADFSPVERFFHRIFENFLKFPPAEGTFLNVNFPAIPPEEIKGIKFAAQGMGRWTKEFNLYTDPHGYECLWMAGRFINKDNRRDNADHLLMEQGYVAITVQKIDSTDYRELERMQHCWQLA